MKKICIDEEKCIGCGACVAIDNEHFDFNENGLSNQINQENLESANLQSAIESCPTGAISLKDGCNCDCGCDDEHPCTCDDCNCEHKNN